MFWLICVWLWSTDELQKRNGVIRTISKHLKIVEVREKDRHRELSTAQQQLTELSQRQQHSSQQQHDLEVFVWFLVLHIPWHLYTMFTNTVPCTVSVELHMTFIYSISYLSEVWNHVSLFFCNFIDSNNLYSVDLHKIKYTGNQFLGVYLIFQVFQNKK